MHHRMATTELKGQELKARKGISMWNIRLK